MAGELFGAPAGTSQAIQDSNVLSQMSARNFEVDKEQQMLPGAIQLQAANTLSHLAQAKYSSAHADQVVQATKESQAAASVLSQFANQGGGQPNEPISIYLKRMAQQVLPVSPKMGRDLMQQSVSMAAHEASVYSTLTKAQSEKMTAEMKKPEWVAQNARLVRAGLMSWDQLDQGYTRTFNEPPPWAGVPQTDAMLDHMEQQALSSRDRMQQQHQELQRKATEAWRERQERMKELQLDVTRETAKATAEAKARNTKVGGAVLSAPAKTWTDMVTGFVKRDFEKVPMNDEARAFVTSVATEAAELRKSNPGAIGMEEALNRVYTDRKKQLVDIMDTETKMKSFQYNSPVGLGSKVNPIIIDYNATAGTASIPESKRKVGQWYFFRGKPRMWAKEGDEYGWAE